MPKAFRSFLLVAGIVAIGLAFWSVIGDIRSSAQDAAFQSNYARPLLLSILGGALLSASRYKG